MRELSKEEFENQSSNNEAIIFTKDLETYQLNESQYCIKADTLYGSGSKIISGDNKIPFSGKIPLENVSSISVKKSDGLATTFLVIGIIAGAVLIIGAVIVGSVASKIPD